MSEEESLGKLISGDRQAFNMLYEKYSRQLYFFSKRFVKDDQVALDVVQDVFLKIWEGRKALRTDGTFSAYIMKIAYNHILNGIRKNLNREKYKQYQTAHQPLKDTRTEDQIIYRDLFKTTQQIIDQLPEKRKAIFKLSRNHGLSNKEIADQLQLSIRTVENHIHKSLLFLKDRIVTDEDYSDKDIKLPKNFK